MWSKKSSAIIEALASLEMCTNLFHQISHNKLKWKDCFSKVVILVYVQVKI